MKLVNVIITGTGRGLGLQFVKEFVRLPQPPKHVIATCRRKSLELSNIAAEHQSVRILELDVKDETQYSRFVDDVRSIVGDSGIDLLINNAGIYDKTVSTLQEVTKESLMSHFETNCVAPVLLTKAILPLLRQAVAENKRTGNSITSAAVLNISSLMGCSDHVWSMPLGLPYRVSKAALNKASHCLSVELQSEDILVGSVHPGWVRTDMGTSAAPLEIEDSVRQMMNNVVLKLGPHHSGKLFMHDGTEMTL